MNKPGFNQIYFEYRILVYNLALHYVQNIEDAEEITQDVFVKVYHSLDSFGGKSSFKTWIYRITVNQSLDFVKHKSSKKRFFIFGKKADDKELLKHSTFDHPGIVLENKQKAEILFGVINTLPENQKTAFLLSKLEGLSNPEIADILQVSVGAIESLLVRAKKALQVKLEGKFEEYGRKK